MLGWQTIINERTYNAGALPHVGIVKVVFDGDKNSVALVGLQNRTGVTTIHKGSSPSKTIWSNLLRNKIPVPIYNSGVRKYRSNNGEEEATREGNHCERFQGQNYRTTERTIWETPF